MIRPSGKWILAILVALPSVGIVRMMTDLPWSDEVYARILHVTGELSVRLLILTIVTTPLAMLFRKGRFWKWMRLQRRTLGLAAFAYAFLHTLAYLMRKAELEALIADLGEWTYPVGWLAMLSMLPLVVTSTDSAIRRLGARWKKLHRLVFPAVCLGLLHWLLKPEGEIGPVLVHAGFLCVFLLLRLGISRKRTSRARQDESGVPVDSRSEATL